MAFGCGCWHYQPHGRNFFAAIMPSAFKSVGKNSSAQTYRLYEKNRRLGGLTAGITDSGRRGKQVSPRVLPRRAFFARLVTLPLHTNMQVSRLFCRLIRKPKVFRAISRVAMWLVAAIVAVMVF